MSQIGAAQICFVNPPVLKLDFTGAANIGAYSVYGTAKSYDLRLALLLYANAISADFSLIDDTVRGTILSTINGILTLPNRLLVKLDTSTDYFKTHLYPLGIARVTIEKAWGFAEEAKSATKKLVSKLTRAHPDCFAKVDVGGEESWKTSTKNNSTKPVWNETKDFVVSDFDQCIKINVEDQDVSKNTTPVRQILIDLGELQRPSRSGCN